MSTTTLAPTPAIGRPRAGRAAQGRRTCLLARRLRAAVELREAGGHVSTVSRPDARVIGLLELRTR